MKGIIVSRTTWSLLMLILILVLSSLTSVTAELISRDPIYIRTSDGFKCLNPHNNEYAQFTFKGDRVQPVIDAYHVMLNQHVGMQITFADKKDFGSNKDILESHVKWELSYWRKNSSKVESKDRRDLSGTRTDLKVTEIKLYDKKGNHLAIYMIGLATKDGVYVLAISPADRGIDSMVKEIVDSFILVHRRLDADEVKSLGQREVTPAQ